MRTSINMLQDAGDDHHSDQWVRLVAIYEPLIAGWLAKAGIHRNDVPDVCQEVLAAVAHELTNFQHNGRTGAFRTWLRNITVNRCRRYWDKRRRSVSIAESAGADDFLNQLSDPSSGWSVRWDHEHDQHLLSSLLKKIAFEFDKQTMVAFHRVAVRGESPGDVALELGVSTGQIYKFKFRVMQRLHKEAEGLNLNDTANESATQPLSGPNLLKNRNSVQNRDNH